MKKTLIERIEVGSGGAASITFTSTSTIPADYTDLILVYSARTDRAAVDDSINISINGETTGFSGRELDGDGSSAYSGTVTRFAGFASGATGTSNTFSSTSIYLPNYRSAQNKSYSIDSVRENNTTSGQQIIVAGLRSDVDAIDNITLTPNSGANFVQYTTASLYGVTAGNDGTTTVS